MKYYLRRKGSVPVALVTPYGATKSDFFAVSKDHKLDKLLKPVTGKVGHDRIQQGTAEESIGEAIRRWYRLPAGQFDRIDLDIDIIDDAFYLRPTETRYADAGRSRPIRRFERPLSFNSEYRSRLWSEQLRKLAKNDPKVATWSIGEIARIAADHRAGSKVPHIQEVS